MTHEDLLDIIRKRPFVPFRLFITDGSIYDVRHPELVMLGKRSIAVGLTQDPTQTVYDRLATVDIFHVTRVEPLESGVVSGNSGNGQ